MPFVIPNTADALVTAQAAPDKVDFDILQAGSVGTGVISGCAVTVSTLLTLNVASGTVAVLGVPATVTSGTVVIGTADATNPRFDLVVANSSGTKSVTAGTAAASPVFPAVPASSVCLAAVYVPALLTTVLSGDITDKRVAIYSMTAFSQTLLDDADAATARTTLGAGVPMATDPLWDAAGDLAIGTGADTGVKLTVSTAAGAAPCADPNATNKLSWQYPHGVEAAVRGTTSSLASTYDRATSTETDEGSLSTGRLNLYRIFLPKGLSVTTISFWSMTTAVSVGANQWFALFDSTRAKLAVTADDTSTAWAANTKKTLTVTSGPYVTTTTGWYYLGIMIKATTCPSLAAAASGGLANIRAAAPIPCGTADTGLTNPASCPSTAASPANNIRMVYAEIA